MISSQSDFDTDSSASSLTSSYENNNNNNNNNNNEFINKDFVRLCKGYRYVPAILPATRRIVIFGDVHGKYELAIKQLQIGKVIKYRSEDDIEWIGGDTHVVQVGDQIDGCRPLSNILNCMNPKTTPNDEGSDIKILKLFTELDKKAMEKNGRVISLLGNHELMNVEGDMTYVSYQEMREFDNYVDPDKPDLKFKSNIEARKYAFKPGNEMARFLGCTRLAAIIIGSNLFVHGGILDKILDKLKIKKANDLESINILVKKWLLGLINKEYVSHIINGSSNSMFWTRVLGELPPDISPEDPQCMEYLDKSLKIFKIGSVIVGHTPQSFMYNRGINFTCGKKIIRVDNASASVFNVFDDTYKKTGVISESRRPQVLEILNDSEYNILY